jgi:hypothetical protein
MLWRLAPPISYTQGEHFSLLGARQPIELHSGTVAPGVRLGRELGVTTRGAPPTSVLLLPMRTGTYMRPEILPAFPVVTHREISLNGMEVPGLG